MKKLLKLSLAALTLVALAACGGGGDDLPSGSTDRQDPEQTQVANFNPNVKPIAASTVVPDSGTVSANGGLQLGLRDTQDLKVGDVVMIEPGVNGLTNGYPGKVVSLIREDGVTTAVMERAGIADVFTKLSIDYDSTKDSAVQAGLVVKRVIAAPGVKASFTQKQEPTGIQAGLLQNLCGVSTQAGLTWANNLVCDYSKGTLSGELSLEKNIFVTKSETGEKVGATWKAYFLLSDVKQLLNTNFDELQSRLPKNGDHFEARLSGMVSAGVKLQTPDEDSKFEWALSDLIADATGASLFDDLEWKLKYAELQGLDGSDKAGLLPIAGLVVDAPCVAAAAASGGSAVWKACGFTGALSETRLATAKPFSFILWAYVRADGSLKLSGSLDIVELSDLDFETGLEYTFKDGAKKSSRFGEPRLSMLKLNGAVDADLTVGGELALDFLVGGVRPAAVHFEAYRYEQNYHVEGNAGFQVYPSFQPSGEICYYGTYESSSRIKFLAQLKAAIGDPDWLQVESGFQWSAEPKHTWNTGNVLEPACLSSQALVFSMTRGPLSAVGDPGWKYRVSFPDAFRDLKHSIGRWDVVLNGQDAVEVTPDENGQFEIDLRADQSYSVELRGWHVFEDAAEINGQQPQAVKVRSTRNVVTPALPAIGLSLGLLPAFANAGQEFALWINTTLADISTVVWNFTDVAGEKIVNGTVDALGRVGSTVKSFASEGSYAITATMMDIFGNRIAENSVNVTVLPISVSITTITAEDDRTTPATNIPANGATEDATPVIRGSIGAALPAGYEVRVFKDGETDSFGVATVSGTSWTYTVQANQALSLGQHSFTAGVVLAADGSTAAGPRSAPFVFSMQLPDTAELIEVPASAFVRGENVALSVNGYGADTLMNAPPYDTVANAAEWDIVVPATGQYELFATYAAATSRPVVISFNGATAFANALAAVTGGWFPSNRQTLSQGVVQLNAGANVMRLTRADAFPHIQGFKLVRLESTTSKLPHTGITASQCYAAGGSTLLACSEPGALALNSQQDGHRANINAMSYSQVGSYPITSCVKDNVTGLIWEGKEASGVRAGSNTYTNYHSSYFGTQAQMDAATNTYGYVAAVNAMALCGFTDWRLPTVDELQTIVDYGKAYPGPLVEAFWFPNTRSYEYWSSSQSVAYGDNAWLVDFGYGAVGQSNSRDNAYAVRLVRGTQ